MLFARSEFGKSTELADSKFGSSSSYGSCLENKKLGVGFKFLSYRVFGGYEGDLRDRFAVGGAAIDTVISYFRSFLFSRQDPYRTRARS